MVVAFQGALGQRVLLPDANRSPAPARSPYGHLVERAQGVTHNWFTISAELWINVALEKTNVSRKSNRSTKINEQET